MRTTVAASSLRSAASRAFFFSKALPDSAATSFSLARTLSPSAFCGSSVRAMASDSAAPFNKIQIQRDDTTFDAYVVGKDGAPGIVVLQEWWGVDYEIKNHAVKISQLAPGFKALIPDLYRGKVGLDVAEAQHLMDGLDWQGAVKDIQASVNWLKANGSKKITSNKDLDNKTTEENDDLFDAWNDFASSSNAPNLVDSSVKQSSVDWVRDNQLQTTSNKALYHKTTDAGDDSFDAWNDFASSNNASNLADNSVKQSINQTTSVDHTSETNLFGTSNSGDLDFGSFLQPDFLTGAFNSSNSSTVADRVQPEPSVLDRLVDESTNHEKNLRCGGGRRCFQCKSRVKI